MNQKQKIILKHIDGMSNRSIASELHMSKDTVNKYVNEYENQKQELLAKNPETDTKELIQAYNRSENVHFPKYTSQLINLANQNAQGTRPKVVGQLSELFPEFQKSAKTITIENWEKWYLEKYPNVINNATDKIYDQVENLKQAITLIDKNLIRKWVKDLIIYKTYNGLYVQQAILAF